MRASGKYLCKHCGKEIGQLNNDDVWYHAISDGPDRYQTCRCTCAECYQPLGQGSCINGEIAEPIEKQCEYFIPRGEEDGEECGATAVGINPSLEIPCCKKHVEAE